MPNELTHEVATAASAAVGSKLLYGGASATGLGFLISNEFLGLAGLTVAIIGFFFRSYYDRKEYLLRVAEDRRQQLEHEIRVDALLNKNKGADTNATTSP